MKRLFTALIFCVALASAARAITLDAVLHTTLENNPAIQQAKANLEAASGRRIVLRSIAWPNVRVNAPGGVQGGHRAGSSDTKLFGFVRGSLTQPILNAAIPPSFRRGDVAVLIAEQQLNLAVEQQLHSARLAYYSAAYNRQLLSVRDRQRVHLEQNVASQNDRYRAGLVDRGAFTTATVEARALDPMVEDARRSYGVAQLQLAQLMGVSLSSDVTLPAPEGELNFVPTNVDLGAEINAALDRRTDIKLARLLVRAANEDERIIAAGYYPNVNGVITADYVPVSGIHREGSTSRTNDFLGSEIREGANYTWQVVDNGRVTGAVIKARKAREINEVELHKLEASVGRELTKIRNNLSGIAARHTSFVAGTENAEQTAEAVQQNLGSGLASQLEYRVAEDSHLKTQTGLLEASYLNNVARAEWDRATGRYFQFSEDVH
ncbi:MAG TPA: TolC family protein [Chthoniobacterales bacterium]|nr:TolC family protein [Chthoniobacterales bacterium]